MDKEISKSQVDRLGERLKKVEIEEVDLQLLSQYRRSFTVVYDQVVEPIRNELGLEPTVRPEKSTMSIVDKLRRESIRLSQMQDIAGCRIVVADVASQEAAIRSLRSLFPTAVVIDRRQQPSYGYRAVHLIARCDEKPVEIQIRTQLQHLWAEASEKISDALGSPLKYGGGNEDARQYLLSASSQVADFEVAEQKTNELLVRQVVFEERLTKLLLETHQKEALQREMRQALEDVLLTKNQLRQTVFDYLHMAGTVAEVLKE